MSSWLNFVINHPSHQHLLSESYVPETVLEAGEVSENKRGTKEALLSQTINK